MIESHLARETAPIQRGDGIPRVYTETLASLAAWVEADSEQNGLSSMEGVMSLVPNRAPIGDMPLWAGFDRVTFLEAPAGHDSHYVEGDRAIVAAEVVLAA